MPQKQYLVLVPGLLCTRELYAPQTAALADAVSMHHADHTSHDSMAAIAGAILAAAPPRFALCGLSMGGYIAFEIMRQAPARVTRLALLDTNAHADPPDRAAFRRGLAAVAARDGFAPVMAKLAPLFLGRGHVHDPDLRAIVDRMAADTGVVAFRRQQEAIIARPDSRSGLAAIHCPTLVLVGRDDVLTPVADHEVIARAIPGCRLEIIGDCGHLSTLEQPAAVNRALLQWLDM